MRSLICSLAVAGLLTGCSEQRDVAPPVKNALEEMQQLTEMQQTPRDRNLAQANADSIDLIDGECPTTGEYEVRFETTVGGFTVVVNREWAPRGAHRFYQMVKDGFYDDCGFFRVVPDFMVQFGIAASPEVHKRWESPILDDPVKQSNKRGYMTFATSGPDSRTSQVFINFKSNDFLDDQGFSPFGRVTEGMEVVDKISAAHREEPKQHMIEAAGNAYLKENFPQLDYVKTAKIVVDDLGPATEADESLQSSATDSDSEGKDQPADTTEN